MATAQPTTAQRALVLVDVQQDYLSGPLQIRYPPVGESLKQILRALEAAGDAGLPVVNVRHLSGPSSPVFNPDLPGSQLIREVAAQRTGDWREITKHYSSIYAGTHLADWLIEQQINTVTLVGFMSHNCVLSSAVEAEALGLRTEVLSDATGAINLATSAGAVDAATLHSTVMTLLSSNWAAVATTSQWEEAVLQGRPLEASGLVAAAQQAARQLRGDGGGSRASGVPPLS